MNCIMPHLFNCIYLLWPLHNHLYRGRVCGLLITGRKYEWWWVTLQWMSNVDWRHSCRHSCSQPPSQSGGTNEIYELIIWQHMHNVMRFEGNNVITDIITKVFIAVVFVFILHHFCAFICWQNTHSAKKYELGKQWNTKLLDWDTLLSS